MWIVSIDIEYYPWIEKFKTKAEAMVRYEELVENIGSDECVFLSKVEEFACGKDYEMEYEK